MVKSPLNTLVQEHIVARNIVAVLGAVARHLKDKKSVSIVYLAELIDAVTEVMEMHHKKEMEIFPFFAENPEINRDELLNMLSEEHKLGLEYLSNIGKLIKLDERGEKEKYDLLPFHIEQYASLLEEHIEKEEAGFFPLVRDRLSVGQIAILNEEFAGIDKQHGCRKSIDILNEARKRYR